MERDEHLASEFEEHRDHLTAVAYRMLGSVTEAEDAVQEAWLRLQRSDDDRIMNLGGWLTTAVARVSLDMLRARRTKSLDPFEEGRMPDPLVERYGDLDPEHEAVLADSVGLAVLVVLETLTPAERLAFVLHDMFSVPFGEIAEIVGRTPEASRQLASRARRRVRGSAPVPDRDLRRRREVGDAFLAASRDGRFEDLLALLDPDVVLRVDEGDGVAPRIVHGAEAVSRQAFAHSQLAQFSRPALVNGDPGGVVVQDGVTTAIVALTVADGRIVAMDILADPRRRANLDLSEFGGEHRGS
ncbi:MAG TPA: sigma-70 family RNA polymerase sigma factor [Microbacterium sp.]|nr:sigma-70 family RNA polymerase sigma factor [Microbacterium sp.]